MLISRGCSGSGLGLCDGWYNAVLSVKISIRTFGFKVIDCVLVLSPHNPFCSRQKYAHVRQSQRDSKPYYTSVVWWCGVILMGIGELGNFAAYGFAPASLIAPLGCVSVIGKCNLFLTSYIIHV